MWLIATAIQRPEGAHVTADDLVADAQPTKEFFIFMLGRDIDLIPAIVDLVDNCLDGARRLRGDGSFEGLWVRLDVSPEEFRIADNCGGIPLEVARKYAFRFGRPAGMEPTPHSVGQFGVGMKRALFKLGEEFRVTSITPDASFILEVDVPAWQGRPEWDFPMTQLEPSEGQEAGTRIVVTRLYENVAQRLGRQSFVATLAEDLSSKHQPAMRRGLSISLNGVPLDVDVTELLQSDALPVETRELTFFEDDDHPVNVKLFAGLSASAPQDAGWYVYCNGRLILGPDQGPTTGWGEGDESAVPRYHNRYARFRGYAFFDSDDSSRLPWTTTKTGVDMNSDLFQAVRQRMVTLMKPVLEFLRNVERERETPPQDTLPLESIVADARAVSLDQVRMGATFAARPRQVYVRPPSSDQSIQYRRPVAQIERAKRVLGVLAAREVGERSFDYFFARECGEEE
jgi:hypothetical protein